jgi:alcohol dehydrogenase class IV
MADVDILPESLILPPRTILRPGAVTDLLIDCAEFGDRGMLVHGRSLVAAGTTERILRAHPETHHLDVRLWHHPGGEPTLTQLDGVLEAARRHQVDWVAGVGGGSVIDLAKAAAGLLHAPLEPRAYHDGEAIETSRVPFIAVPTTAGTGSEATIVCVLTNAARGVKKSIRHPSFIARLVILDPSLLTGCPREILAHSGMDAFTQAVESFLSVKATWWTETLSLESVRLLAASLEAVCGGAKGDAQRDLMTGSYLAGVALSNARLGLVHGLAHPLGVRYHQPHGLVCAACLPPVLRFNMDHIKEKYRALSDVVGGDLLTRVDRLLRVLDVTSPFRNQPVLDGKGIVEETLASGSTAANPRPVSPGDVKSLLRELFPGAWEPGHTKDESAGRP